MSTGLIALLLGVVALLGIAIWSIKRHKDPHLELHTDAPLAVEAPEVVFLSTIAARMRMKPSTRST